MMRTMFRRKPPASTSTAIKSGRSVSMPTRLSARIGEAASHWDERKAEKSCSPIISAAASRIRSRSGGTGTCQAMRRSMGSATDPVWIRYR